MKKTICDGCGCELSSIHYKVTTDAVNKVRTVVCGLELGEYDLCSDCMGEIEAILTRFKRANP